MSGALSSCSSSLVSISQHSGAGPPGGGLCGALVHPEALLAPTYPLHCFFDAVGVNQIKSKIEPSPSYPYLPFLNPVQVPITVIKQFI